MLRTVVPMNGPSAATPVEPCDFTVFGGTGDLALRKLLPALYLRDRDGQLPDGFRIIGVSRAEVDDEGYRAMVGGRARRARQPPTSSTTPSYARLLGRLHHVDPRRRGRRRVAPAARPAQGRRRERGRHPGLLPRRRAGALRPICEHLDQVGLVTDRSRVVLEKPIGTDLATAETVNEAVGRVFDESSIFRIDHYLGKESVQNLLVTRFANTFLEPLWNSRWVDHVQITVVGVDRASASAAPTTTAPARCATWCRTTCSSCCAWSRWSRRRTSTARRSATRSSRSCRRCGR